MFTRPWIAGILAAVMQCFVIEASGMTFETFSGIIIPPFLVFSAAFTVLICFLVGAILHRLLVSVRWWQRGWLATALLMLGLALFVYSLYTVIPAELEPVETRDGSRPGTFYLTIFPSLFLPVFAVAHWPRQSFLRADLNEFG